jgi:uncharacterized protein with FMN-binding domain
MKSKKKIRIIVLLVFVVILVTTMSSINYIRRVNRYQESVSKLTYENIDILSIVDGAYIGECNVDFIYSKVKVIVKDGKITKIDLLEHKNERGSTAEKITNDIIKEQRIDVDAISGATNSSKVIKKAVENAIKNK